MAYCYNCKTEISDSDKTRLCDRCKSILLPFVKFTNASTSSAVRRLVSNERNLRNAGVTDSGMEYLLRICEVHDKRKIQEREAKNAERAASESVAKTEDNIEQPVEYVREYSEIELPADEPLEFIPKEYGRYLTAAKAVCMIAGIGLIIWFAIELIVYKTTNAVSIVAAVPALGAAYGIHTLKKILHDLNEMKKRFK